MSVARLPKRPSRFGEKIGTSWDRGKLEECRIVCTIMPKFAKGSNIMFVELSCKVV